MSTSDNTITITGHNILTGTKFTYQDGSGTALAGLTDNTAYFAIKVDNDTIKLATNLSNANAKPLTSANGQPSQELSSLLQLAQLLVQHRDRVFPFPLQ